MMRPSRDAIQSYMSITGADESLAIQTLEEHGNNLTEAINSHFRDVERSILDPSSDSRRPQYNAVEDNSHITLGGLPSLLSAARSFRPSLLLDPNYRRSLLRQLSGSAISSPPPSAPHTHTAEVTGFPANNHFRPPGLGEFGGDGYARHSPTYGSQVYGSTTHRDAESPVYGNDAEDEMIRAAIEASKKDFQEGRNNVPSSVLSSREAINKEDEDIARAISMSIEMEEQESVMREQLAELMSPSVDQRQSYTNESNRYKPGSSTLQDKRDDIKQKQPMSEILGAEHRRSNADFLSVVGSLGRIRNSFA
ncbi:Plant UBX domain-containing protein 9 [Raphanus sativus]|nr:Plant UBX domain-containing protein 9 [Raphanus sativus]